jgi:hypothetical protein
LFTEGSIVGIEHEAEHGGDAGEVGAASPSGSTGSGALGIGSLKSAPTLLGGMS